MSTAVSREWPVLYADWSGGSKADFSKYAMSCFSAICSSNFDTTKRLDIGLYDLTSPVSIPERSNVGDFECIRNKAAQQWLVEKAGETRSDDTDDGVEMCCWQWVECTVYVLSLTVTDWNWLNDPVEGFGEKDGGGTSDVVDCTRKSSCRLPPRPQMTPISVQLAVSQVYLDPRTHTMHSDESAFHAYHTFHSYESACPHLTLYCTTPAFYAYHACHCSESPTLIPCVPFRWLAD